MVNGSVVDDLKFTLVGEHCGPGFWPVNPSLVRGVLSVEGSQTDKSRLDKRNVVAMCARRHVRRIRHEASL
jgi:hypothetical protein